MILRQLFPRRETFMRRTVEVDLVPLFTIDELRKAASELSNKKSPGPDGVPAEVIKVIAGSNEWTLLKVMNAVLEAGKVPEQWKVGEWT